MFVNDHAGDDGEGEEQFVNNSINESTVHEPFRSMLSLIICFITKWIVRSKINNVIEAYT